LPLYQRAKDIQRGHCKSRCPPIGGRPTEGYFYFPFAPPEEASGAWRLAKGSGRRRLSAEKADIVPKGRDRLFERGARESVRRFGGQIVGGAERLRASASPLARFMRALWASLAS